jgi:hypothetical protein
LNIFNLSQYTHTLNLIILSAICFSTSLSPTTFHCEDNVVFHVEK